MEKGSSSSSSSGGGADSFNGLKFGKKIHFEGVGSGLQPKIGEEAPPPRSPAKKGRTAVAQPPRCQVEGCKADLSDAKAYYFRHKVCGVHSKSPMVIVAGLEQRFCQQCSRFHQLAEFDQGKRSCRRRLAGHNERRRKPPRLSPSILDSIRSGGLLPDFSSYAASEQATSSANSQLPWRSSSSQGLTTTRPSYTNGGDFSSALSLLSNRSQTADLGFLAQHAGARYSWDFKADDSLHGINSADMGLFHPANAPSGLVRPARGIGQRQGYQDSLHYISWSLSPISTLPHSLQ